VTHLGTILSDALESGCVAQNVVASLAKRKNRERNKAAQKRKLEVGVDIPTPEEIRTLIKSLADDNAWRPLILTAIFTGLRASELRGLRWSDVDFKQHEIRVRQRADKYLEIGKPKSQAGNRTVPLYPNVASALKAWKIKRPPSALGLVFPDSEGGVEKYKNIRGGLDQALIAAGVCVFKKDADGKLLVDSAGNPLCRPKYTGLHMLRHFYASWCLNRRANGGLELPLKDLQARMGHATLAMTADTYGHLFSRADDAEELAAAERTLLG
jgi:integrase